MNSHTDGTRCELCHHGCVLKEGRPGRCGVRQLNNGKIESLVYGRLVAEHVDPIEKKPFFHILPGSRSYSIATAGCNFRCLHCQNSSISQVTGSGPIPGQRKSPEAVVAAALANGCDSISYTYVEPTVFFEFARDCCWLGHEGGLKNLFVSNGFMSPQVLESLAPTLDGINIDLKAFTDSFYKSICGGRLEPVCETISMCLRLGIWVEVTTLLIPGLNDSDAELQELCQFLVSVSPDIPWHVTGFYPSYKMTDRPPTPAASLVRAREIGLAAGIKFVYTGNRPGLESESSFCPDCGALLIERRGFSLQQVRLRDGRCPQCGIRTPGIWK